MTLAPVIVASPVPRLLCSAPDALVYGDSVGQQMEFRARHAA
jgi:hypothetical protein